MKILGMANMHIKCAYVGYTIGYIIPCKYKYKKKYKNKNKKKKKNK